MIGRACLLLVSVLAALSPATLRGQSPSPRVAALIDAVKPALPFPAADDSGTVPAGGGDDAKWFVVWPVEEDDTTIAVRANPLHPETQKLVASAETAIQRAVADAERKAQAAYQHALDELKRTGKTGDLDGISLDDEGAAGQRLDAELELSIELVDAASYEVVSGVAPTVTAGPAGVTWQVLVPANTVSEGAGRDRRDRFIAAQARLLAGPFERPGVERIDGQNRYAVSIPAAPGGMMVVLRGHEGLLKQVLAGADWTQIRIK